MSDEENSLQLTRSQRRLIQETWAIETEAAKEAGLIGYMARMLVLATLPHSKREGNEFTRANGNLTLTIVAPSAIGIPYGTIPRLLLAWITTEAVLHKSPEIILGSTLSGFMKEIGMSPTGGRWGTIPRLREQMRRLFASAISCTYKDGAGTEGGLGYKIAKQYNLWWDPKDPEQIPLWESTLTLSHDFFQEIVNSPIPVDFRALKALRRSPMALDIYNWLTYRMSYLKKRTTIPWTALQLQFGADYCLTRLFKQAFLAHLEAVKIIYPDVNLDLEENGLVLLPSKTHVPQIPLIKGSSV